MERMHPTSRSKVNIQLCLWVKGLTHGFWLGGGGERDVCKNADFFLFLRNIFLPTRSPYGMTFFTYRLILYLYNDLLYAYKMTEFYNNIIKQKMKSYTNDEEIQGCWFVSQCNFFWTSRVWWGWFCFCFCFLFYTKRKKHNFHFWQLTTNICINDCERVHLSWICKQIGLL